MALTASTMLPLGTQAPSFSLPDVVSGKLISLDDFKNTQNTKGLLIMFICQHCPYVKHVQEEIAKIGRDYQNKQLSIVAISSNDAENYPDDSPSNLKKMAQSLKFTFPFCYDGSQSVAKAYQAACTPDFFLFDDKHKLVYRGQLDDSRPGNAEPINGKDLRAAINAVLSNKPVNSNQKSSVGCNIKWKANNSPKY
jgi:peroxiredoxin